MNNDFYKKIAEALQQVEEKKTLDPVNPKAAAKKFDDRKDKDIDNDGDVDSSDKFLHKRRKAIGKSMAKEAADEMDECPECGGSTENHEPDCSKADSSKKKKLEDDKDLDAKSAGKALKHDCATHVTSEQWGYGECISGQHTLEEQEDGTGVVTHYDVMFEHGIEENVAVEDLTILREKSHLHAAKKVKEGKTHAERTKGASKEGPLDKYKRSYNDGMEKSKVNQMAQDAEADNPKHADITPEEEGHNDAVKAGRVTKQAKSRGNDNLSNGDKTPPKAKGAK